MGYGACLELAVEAVAGLVGGVEVGVHPGLAATRLQHKPVLTLDMYNCTYCIPDKGSIPGTAGKESTPGTSGKESTPGTAGKKSTPGTSGKGSTPGASGKRSTPGVSGKGSTPGTSGK